jgi:hypothetical protein
VVLWGKGGGAGDRDLYDFRRDLAHHCYPRPTKIGYVDLVASRHSITAPQIVTNSFFISSHAAAGAFEGRDLVKSKLGRAGSLRTKGLSPHGKFKLATVQSRTCT